MVYLVPQHWEKEGTFKIQVGEGRGVRKASKGRGRPKKEDRSIFPMGFYFFIRQSIELVM